jgi:hypothetical protein
MLSGGGLGSYGPDPIDGDRGFRRTTGNFRRDVPPWTRERARDHAVTAYRVNPMCRAIVDTLTAFAVGDSGVSPICTDPQVKEVVDEFWNDPRNNLGSIQEVSMRSQLLLGEKLYEMMVGPSTGAVRFCPIEPAAIKTVKVYKGNPLWPDVVVLPPTRDSNGEDEQLKVVQVEDETGLRDGRAMFWAPWRALDTDIRGVPYIDAILDSLDAYDLVLNNLIDRTSVARYFVVDVAVEGGQKEVDAFVAARGGNHLPPSGSMEIHNKSVEFKPFNAQTGAFEDTRTNGAVLTSVSAGAGLARTWLADPEDSNRATSLTMAEPVRRRVGGVQRIWLAQQTELCRFAVDRAVAAKRLPATVKVTDPRTGEEREMSAASTVVVTGPEIAAADSQLAAQVMLNLSTGLNQMVEVGIMSQEAAKYAARKAWEDYVGVPYRAELDSPDANPDDVATAVDSAGGGGLNSILGQLRLA